MSSLQPRRILILFAHPALERSRVNRRLLTAVDGLVGVTVRDLYEVYPDYEIDVAAEQALCEQHDLIVFQHPLYWYSTPALLKEWQDLVLEYGFAYGSEGHSLDDKTAHQRWSRPAAARRRLFARTAATRPPRCCEYFLLPFEHTAKLCRMRVPGARSRCTRRGTASARSKIEASTSTSTGATVLLLEALRDRTLRLRPRGRRRARSACAPTSRVMILASAEA